MRDAGHDRAEAGTKDELAVARLYMMLHNNILTLAPRSSLSHWLSPRFSASVRTQRKPCSCGVTPPAAVTMQTPLRVGA